MTALFTKVPLLATAWLVLAGDWLGQAQSQASPASQPPPSKVGSVPVRFDRQEIKTSAEPGVGVVEMCYEFTNTGELPLVVEEIAHSCGCMRGAWDGVPVQPGARGKINAKFLTNGLRGTIRKSLHVKFVECGVVELIGEVIIPEALTYSAQTLRWVIGETARSKQVDIAIISRVPLRVLSVCGNDPAFACDLQTIEEARSYRIVITPRDTGTARVCVLQVRTDSKDPRDALHGLSALVEKAKPEGVRP